MQTAPAGTAPAPRKDKSKQGPEDASWISPWAAATLFPVALALSQASLIGFRWLTIAFALLGLAVVPLTAWLTRASAILGIRFGSLSAPPPAAWCCSWRCSLRGS